jgi:adenylate cyclase
VFDEDHIAHACYAALHAQKRLQRSNQRWAERGWSPIAMRIGVHTNDVVVGIIGSTEHMSYTALGDGVNISSRLEGLNKIYGTRICVSQTIYKAVGDRFLMRPLDYVSVKGRKEPIVVYELMAAFSDPDDGATPEQQEKALLTQEAFSAWRDNDLSRARELYCRLLERFPDDTPAQYQMKRFGEQLQSVTG